MKAICTFLPLISLGLFIILILVAYVILGHIPTFANSSPSELALEGLSNATFISLWCCLFTIPLNLYWVISTNEKKLQLVSTLLKVVLIYCIIFWDNQTISWFLDPVGKK